MALLHSGAASAQGRLVAVASGDCRDPDLLSDTRLLTNELRSRVKDGILEEDAFRERLAPVSTKSPDELSRQLDAAETLYSHARFDPAEVQVNEAIEQIERLPVGKARWELALRGHLLHALLQRYQTDPKKNSDALMDQALSWVLRHDPNYKLVGELYSPVTKDRFERLRKQVAVAKKTKLEVKSRPSGADVYLDGMYLGKTPFQAELMPSEYQVVVASKDGLTSLPHLANTKAAQSLYVDLQFEGAIHPERAPCLSNEGDEKGRLDSALKLAAMLGVDTIVVLRLERQAAGPSWLAATVMEVRGASKLREGGIKVANHSRAPEGLGELAEFIVTGKKSDVVVPAPPVPNGQSGAGMPPGSTSPAGAAPATPPPFGRAFNSSPRTWKTPVGLGLGAVGLLAAGVGTYFQLQSAGSWATFNHAYEGGAVPTRDMLSSLQQAQLQAQAQHTVAVGGFIAGGALLAGGAVLTLLDLTATPPSSPVAVRVTASPTSVGMTVRFP